MLVNVCELLAVVVPKHVVKAVLLYALHPNISLKAFLLSAPLSSIITSSSEVLIASVLSVNSDKSKDILTVPLLPLPSKPAEVVIQAILPTPVPVQQAPGILLKPSSKLSSAAHDETVVPLITNLLLPIQTLPSAIIFF